MEVRVGTIRVVNTILRQRGPVATVVLDRPERRNALSAELMSEIEGVLTGLGENSEIQVVVIAGNGPAFSAGHDLREMVDAEPAFHDALFAGCVSMMQTIHRIPQPVIARVHGPATAAGCQLVAACDLAVAAEDAWFATPGVNIGLFCSTPMVPLTRAVGRKRAMEMLLTGQPVDAATAAAWGLINRAVPADELDDEIDGLVERITASSRRVVALGKQAFYRQIDMAEEDAYEYAADVMTGNAQLPDAHEGIGAFLDKRAPQWPASHPATSGAQGMSGESGSPHTGR